MGMDASRCPSCSWISGEQRTADLNMNVSKSEASHCAKKPVVRSSRSHKSRVQIEEQKAYPSQISSIRAEL